MNKKSPTTLNAGRFSTWVRNIRVSLSENRSMAVPCGYCNVCCRSSQFVHIKPGEIRTLNRIPNELLFPTPLLPKGCMILGYDEYGRCPMFKRDECSIYRNRPATCRIFDCRILTASGVKVIEKNYHLVAKQAQRWQFSFSNDHDHKLHSAVQSAAAFLAAHRDSFPAEWVPRNSIQLAFLSIIVCDAFLKINGRAGRNSDIVKNILTAFKKFENRKRCTSPVVTLRS